MDGFDTNEQVILVAATNRPDILDPALRRPGRFDREVVLSLPDMKEREAILKVHAKKVKLAEGVDLMRVARGTPGFSGADLAAVINEGALAATMLDKDAVELADLEEARDKVRWGRAKRSRAMDEADRRISAHHEAGHALVSLLLQPDVEPLHKVSIIPRGMALGSTMFLPKKDRQLIVRKECLGNVKVSLAGRLAEEIFCGDISSGAANDIQQATELVRRMVMDWGMSDRIGPIRYSGAENGPDWWPGDMGGRKAYSEVTAREIDEEVKRILDKCFEETRLLVEQNKEQMALLAEALLKHEVLDAEEVEKVIKGEPIARDSGEEEKASGGEKVVSEEQADAEVPEAGTVAEDLAKGGTVDNPGGGAGAENLEGTA